MLKWPTASANVASAAGGHRGCRAERHVPSGLTTNGRDAAIATARARTASDTMQLTCTWPSFGFCTM